MFQNHAPGGSFWMQRESPISWRCLRTLLLRVPFSPGRLKIAPNVSSVVPRDLQRKGFETLTKNHQVLFPRLFELTLLRFLLRTERCFRSEDPRLRDVLLCQRRRSVPAAFHKSSPAGITCLDCEQQLLANL